MLSRADLVHDLADVLHQARMRQLAEGSFASETVSMLPTRRDREQAEDVVDRLIELRIFGAVGSGAPERTA